VPAQRDLSETDAIKTFCTRAQTLADPFLFCPTWTKPSPVCWLARERRRSAYHLRRLRREGVTRRRCAEVLGNPRCKVNYYLPHRMDEGYGLSQTQWRIALKKFPTTLLLRQWTAANRRATIAG